MPTSCDLDIELDDPERRYRAGDEVAGTVHLRIDEDCECEALTVTAQWTASGRGAEARGREFRTEVFSGPLYGGEEQSHRFELTLPNGPCTYRGEYLSVDWEIEADLDVPWSRDSTAELPIEVRPADEPLEESYRTGNPGSSHHDDAEERRETRGSRLRTGVLTACLVPMFVAAVLLTGAGVVATADDPENLKVVAVGAFVAAMSGFVYYRMVLRNKISETKLGDVGVGVEETRIPRGDTARVRVDIPSPSGVRLDGVSVELTGREKAMSPGRGTRGRTDTLHRDEEVIPDSRDLHLTEGDSAHFEIEMPIPEDAPPSFHAYFNEVAWAVEVEVDLREWPNWQQKIPLDVVPAPGGEPDAGAPERDSDVAEEAGREEERVSEEEEQPEEVW